MRAAGSRAPVAVAALHEALSLEPGERVVDRAALRGGTHGTGGGLMAESTGGGARMVLAVG